MNVLVGNNKTEGQTTCTFLTLLFIQNISRFLIGLNPPAISSSPAGTVQIWRFFQLLDD